MPRRERKKKPSDKVGKGVRDGRGKNEDIERAIRLYLNSPEPPRICPLCAGTLEDARSPADRNGSSCPMLVCNKCGRRTI